MASESASPDDFMDMDTKGGPRPPRPNNASTQDEETGGAADVGEGAAAPLVQEVPRDGTPASTIRAFTDDDPPVPLLHVVDPEKESEGPQLHDGPPGPPPFPSEFDDSLAKRGNELEQNPPPDHARDDASTSCSTVGASVANAAATAGPLMRPQLLDGPPGPPRFPSEFDDSLAKRVENELERNRSDHAGDDASTARSTMGASLASAAATAGPSMDVEEEDGTASSQGATQSIRSHIEAAVATAPVDFNVPVEGPSTLIFDAYRVEEAETPGGGTVYEAELAEPNVVLRFYQRKGFVPFMIAVSLLAVVITVVAGVLLSKNLGDRNTDGDPPPPGDSSAGQSALKSLASTSAPATINFDVPYPMPVGSIGIRPNLSVAPTNLPVIELTTSPAESLMYKATQSPTWEPSTPWPTWQPTLTPTTSLPTNPPFFQAPVVPSLGNGAQGVPTLATETSETPVTLPAELTPSPTESQRTTENQRPLSTESLRPSWTGTISPAPSPLSYSPTIVALTYESTIAAFPKTDPTFSPSILTNAPTSNPMKSLTLSPNTKPASIPNNLPTRPPVLMLKSSLKLLAPDGAAEDYFGISTAIYSDTIVACAYQDDDKPNGSAHVFVLSGEEWNHQGKLLAPDGAANDSFGKSVAIYEDTIVVGAFGDDDNGEDSGSAHVFVLSRKEWTHQAKLLAPDGAAGDWFGWSVAIYEDVIVVGAPSDGDNGWWRESGSAYVFVRSGEEWTHQAKLMAPDGAACDAFGTSVSIYDNSIAVGAWRDDDNGFASGSAYVFVRSGEQWTDLIKLLAPDGAADDSFGTIVVIYGDTIVAGASRDDDKGENSGSAHVFVRSGGEWVHQAKLLAPDGAPEDLFGESVAIYEDTIVIGADGDDDNGSTSGSAHVFVRNGEEWEHHAKLLAPDGAAEDNLGHSVALYKDTIVVGAWGDDDIGNLSGSAHLFVV